MISAESILSSYKNLPEKEDSSTKKRKDSSTTHSEEVKLEIIRVVNNGMRQKDAAEKFNVSRAAVCRYVQAFKKKGSSQCL